MLAPSGRHAGQLVHDAVDQLLRPGRLRWLLVLVPVAIVAGLELLSDTILDEALPFPWDTLLVVAAVFVLGLSFAVVASRRIDALTGALRARNAELESRGASARALYRVSVAIAALSDIDEVLDAIVVHARDLLAADVAVLLLERPDGSTERRAAAGGPGTIIDAPATRNRSASPGDEILPFVAPGSAVVRLSAPLRRGGQTIGLLAIGAATPRGFDADEVETLASLANQAAIALEHDRLETRLRELAVVEERERIARELHDGIAQVLGYVSTKSLAIDGYLAGRARDRGAGTGDRARCRGTSGVRRRPRGDPRPEEPDRARPRPRRSGGAACPACRRRFAFRPRGVGPGRRARACGSTTRPRPRSTGSSRRR